MRIRTAFHSEQEEPLPVGYAIPEPSELCRRTLKAHGLVIERLAEPVEATVSAFLPSEVRRAQRPFQGHHEIGLRGEWGAAGPRTLPAGTWILSTRQPLGRVVAQLLEPLSEDSLSTWNVFEEGTRAEDEDGPGSYPVLRLTAPLSGEVVE